MTGFTRYAQLEEAGASAVTVWQQAEADGLDRVTCIRLLREIYGLGLVEAKAVSIEARSGSSLEDHQERFLQGLDEVLESKD